MLWDFPAMELPEGSRGIEAVVEVIGKSADQHQLLLSIAEFMILTVCTYDLYI